MDIRAARKHRHKLKRYKVRVAKREARMAKRTGMGHLMYKASRRSQLH